MPLKDPVKRKAYHDAYSKAWYARRRETHKLLQHKTRDARRRENYEYIKTAKATPCADCHIQYPAHIMQFDHLPGNKKVASISRMRSWSIQRITDEIAKCEVVCANCHADRTYQRRITEVQLGSNE